MSGSIEQKKKYLSDLMIDCEKRWRGVQPYLQPGSSLNTIDARINGFIEYLIEIGVVTEEQIVDFDIRQTESIHEKLKEIERQVQNQQRRTSRSSLVVPKGSQDKKLIVPGQDQ